MRICEFSKEQVLLVREKIEQILWRIGMRVEMAEVRDLCAAAGAEVRGDRVHFSPEVLNRLLALAPKSYEIRSPYGRSWTIGDGSQHMAGIVVDPWINDPAGVRRPAMEDLLTNMALMEHYDEIVMVSRMDFPMTDYEGDISSYKALEQFFLNYNKHISAYCTSVESLQEYFEIGQTALGDQPLKDSKIMTVAVATLSPMALTDINCRLMLEAVKYNFPIIPTTCPMAGTTSPYTLIGTFMQGMAEVVGLCAIVQAVNPGNPYLMAYGPSVSSLLDGHDMYYTVEKPLWKLAATEIAASYGLPYLAECGGNTPAGFDMQAGAESMIQMLSAVGSGADLLAGVGSCYNANGLSAENIVIGMSLKRQSDFMTRGIRLEQIDESIDSIEEQKDLGYFLMDDLTLEHMRSGEFFADSTLNMAGEFKEEPSMLERAQGIIRKVKENYVNPVPADAQERIADYFAKTIYPRFY